MKKRPTQQDVARLAGVSRGTVSLVINGMADGRVPISEETRLRVMAAVEELGYEPDASARALRSGDTRTIGLVIPDIRNPHFWDNVAGVEQAARAAGYHLLFTSLDLMAGETTEAVYKDLLSQRVDGVILMGKYLERTVEANKIVDQLRLRGLYMVEISDRYSPDHHVDSAVSDYHDATLEILYYLLQMGHRRIGFIYGVAPGLMETGMDRLQPYQECLHMAGLPLDEDLIFYTGPTVEDGYQGMLHLLKMSSRPTAVLAINDLLAMGAVRAAADLGLSIPRDVSLVGFDDIFSCSYQVPRLTTVSKDAVNMGREAVRLLIERIRDPQQPLKHINFPARLIMRESTGPAPV